MKNNIVVCVAACLLAATAYGDDVFESACRPPQIVLAHINGIQTTREEAKFQLKKYIQPAVQAQYQSLGLDQYSNLEFKLLYNYTWGPLDFAETFNQRLLGTALVEKMELAWGARDKGATNFFATMWNTPVSISQSLAVIMQPSFEGISFATTII